MAWPPLARGISAYARTRLKGLDPQGDPAHGARYNSSVRYVSGKPHCLAIVISEDGSLEWLAGGADLADRVRTGNDAARNRFPYRDAIATAPIRSSRDVHFALSCALASLIVTLANLRRAFASDSAAARPHHCFSGSRSAQRYGINRPMGAAYRFARVRAAFFAAAERSAALLPRATERACFESACFDAAARPSRLSALSVACERFRDVGFAPPSFAFSRSRLAFSRVSSGTIPFFGGGSFTPARRALERPIAIACFVERAPCTPSRINSISSRTNSPACVLGAFPSLSSWRACSIGFFSGIILLFNFGAIPLDGCLLLC